MKRRTLLLAAWPLMPTAQTLAQTQRQQSAPVYRCGPDGRALSDRPCSAGSAASGVGFDQPSHADQQAARARAQQEAREAEALRQSREQREAQPAPAPQRLSAPSPVPAPASAPRYSAPPRTPRKGGKRRRRIQR